MLTNHQKARSIRALARAEKHYESLGYDPVEAVHLIYKRALKYYDNVFPEDEVGFRESLVRRYDKQLTKATRKEKFERDQEQKRENGTSEDRIG